MEAERAPLPDYNRLAGRALERVWNLSDSVFAFAMTLLALNIHLPNPDAVHSETDLFFGLARNWLRVTTYLLSFLTLGLFWVGQQIQHDLMARSDRNATWLHLVFLAIIVLIPFSTNVMSAFVAFRTALVVYWLNILLGGLLMLASLDYIVRADLLRSDIEDGDIAVVRRRMIRSQCLYAFGAALCVFGTGWSLGFILVVQLYFAIAPPVPWLRRLLT